MARKISKKRKAKVSGNPRIKPYGIEDGITQSLISSFLSCRQKARYYLDGWQSLKPKMALAFGSFWHFALEHSYNCFRQIGEPYSFEIMAGRYKAELKSKGLYDAQLLESVLAMGQALYNPYWFKWTKDDLKRKWIGLETQFDIDFEGFRLRGMRDGVFEDKRGRLWLLETKTKSRKMTDPVNVLAFDFQSLFYLVASETELGKPISGILYNIAYKPQIRQRKGESFPEFAKHLQEKVYEDPDNFFDRFEITFTEKTKEIFRRQLLQKLEEFRKWHVGDLPTYRNETSCVGLWLCEYLPACAANGCMAGFVQKDGIFEELGGR